MAQYKVKVAKSGRKVAVYDANDQLIKVIEASDSTFNPAEAKHYAEALDSELRKQAVQMEDPAEEPTVTTPAELQTESLEEVNEDALGQGAELMGLVSSLKTKLKKASSQIQTLQVQNAKLAEEKRTESKARRAVAIAKEEARHNKLANNEEAITQRVIEITAMPIEDIEILERQAEGLSPFVSKAAAKKYVSSKAIFARMYRQAAEEAMEDGDKETAIEEERKACSCEEAMKFAQDFIEEDENIILSPEEALGCKESAVDEEFEPEDAIDKVNDESIGEAPNMDYQATKLISAYSKIAKINSEIREAAEESGEVEVAEEAEKEAAEAQEKIDILSGIQTERNLKAELIRTYSKLAELHSEIKIAAEESDDEEVAEEAEKEAADAQEKINILSGIQTERNFKAELINAYSKIAELHSEIKIAAEESDDEEVAEEAEKEAADAQEKINILAGEDEYEDDDEEDDDEDEDKGVTVEIESKKSKKSSYQSDLIDTYSKIAEIQEDIRKRAEEADEEEVAKEASEEIKLAQDRLRMLQASDDEDEDDENEDEEETPKMSLSHELASLYRKVAKIHEKIAEDAEDEGEEEVADLADKESETASKKADLLLNAEEEKTAAEDAVMDDLESAEDEPEMKMETGASKMAKVNRHAEGVNKIASTEVNNNSSDSSVDKLALDLWGSKYSNLEQ